MSISELDWASNAHRDGFSRHTVGQQDWCALARGCASGQHDLLAIWVDEGIVRASLMLPDGSLRAIVSTKAEHDAYPSFGQFHPPAIRLERTLRDLTGIIPLELPDTRHWIDHGVWPDSPEEARGGYAFLPVEGEGLHQIPVGPVHAGIIEPGHFRFTANGETVARLEERLGYVHKGIGSLVAGKPVADAARIAARASGDSTVAYSYAFARAVEAAGAIEVPERAINLRAIMAELERIAHHINDFGAICNDTSAVAIFAQCTILREQILQACAYCFGHRLMMDRIVIGGVSIDIADDGPDSLRRLVDVCERDFRRLVSVYDGSPSIQDRTVSTGWLAPDLARQFAAGGYIGRASGRDFDCRRDVAYRPYDSLDFSVPHRTDGDVNARAWIRAEEVGESIKIVRQLLDRLEPGPITTAPGTVPAGEGAALSEAFRGDIFTAVRLDEDGRVAHYHARDASCFQWPLLEAVIEGNIVADFPLCNKSFNCSYAGHDL